MTYEEALNVLESCSDETMKAAAQTACRALKAEIGRAHRFATELEDAESDYVRDIAYDQDLEGENADDFFGKVKADGFDLMEAFHEGAEWQRQREHDGMKFEDFCHVKSLLEDILSERGMERGTVTKITGDLHTQALNVGLFDAEPRKKYIVHLSEEYMKMLYAQSMAETDREKQIWLDKVMNCISGWLRSNDGEPILSYMFTGMDGKEHQSWKIENFTDGCEFPTEIKHTGGQIIVGLEV